MKSDKRFNMTNYTFIDRKYPNKEINGYEYTEDMDGYINVNKIDIYYNLKFIVGSGGAQTRSLRETYHFIIRQVEYILNNKTNTIFINILDGDESYKNMNKFKYLLDKYKKNKIRKSIFVMDLKEYAINYYDIHFNNL